MKKPPLPLVFTSEERGLKFYDRQAGDGVLRLGGEVIFPPEFNVHEDGKGDDSRAYYAERPCGAEYWREKSEDERAYHPAGVRHQQYEAGRLRPAAVRQHVADEGEVRWKANAYPKPRHCPKEYERRTAR